MWEKSNHNISFNRNWQRPNNTEEWSYQSSLKSHIENSHYVEMLYFPWATLIDLLRKGHIDKAQDLKNILKKTPPRMTLFRGTVCQHIYAMDLISCFNEIGITDLFWPHSNVLELERDGIRIHPFPLFPVQCNHILTSQNPQITPIDKRMYLYSFIGSYNSDLYISKIREMIFAMPTGFNSLIKKRNAWHFEKLVYDNQIENKAINSHEMTLIEMEAIDYIETMLQSVFSLCPSGSGPNSIRLWESIGFGSIPILLSDTLRLPGEKKLWDRAIIRLRESPESILNLPKMLEKIYSDKLRMIDMLNAGKELYDRYLKNGPSNVIAEAFSKENIRIYLKRKRISHISLTHSEIIKQAISI